MRDFELVHEVLCIKRKFYSALHNYQAHEHYTARCTIFEWGILQTIDGCYRPNSIISVTEHACANIYMSDAVRAHKTKRAWTYAIGTPTSSASQEFWLLVFSTR